MDVYVETARAQRAGWRVERCGIASSGAGRKRRRHGGALSEAWRAGVPVHFADEQERGGCGGDCAGGVSCPADSDGAIRRRARALSTWLCGIARRQLWKHLGRNEAAVLFDLDEEGAAELPCPADGPAELLLRSEAGAIAGIPSCRAEKRKVGEFELMREAILKLILFIFNSLTMIFWA